MTEAHKILDMLTDPESDEGEINARIAMYVGFTWHGDGSPWENYAGHWHHPDNYGCGGIALCSDESHVTIDNYTASLDDSMSIGEKELEGYSLTVVQHTKTEWFVCLEKHLNEGFLAEAMPSMSRAICHARLQGTAYVRGES